MTPPPTTAALADDVEEDVIAKMDKNLELVIDHGNTAFWQLRERTAIRFEVDVERARKIFAAMRDRFYTRCPPGRRVLTPEPTGRGPGVESIDVDDAILRVRWLKVNELSQLLDRHTDYAHPDAEAHRFLRRRDDLTTTLLVPGKTGHRPKAVQTDTELLRWLLTDYGISASTDIPDGHTEREEALQKVTLESRWYSMDELAEMCRRHQTVAYKLLREQDGLTTDRRAKPGASQPSKHVLADGALAEAIESAWGLEVTIEEPPREVAA